jgi:hypothetical protein
MNKTSILTGKLSQKEEGIPMDNKKKVDDNLPKNKEYIEKFYKKSESDIKKQESEGKVKGNG